MLALGDYWGAGSYFEQAAEASLKQKKGERAIENFMAAGRVYRNVDNRRAAKCFLRAAHMYAEKENYEKAFKCYEPTYRLLEKTKRERETEIALSWMILTQMASARIDQAIAIARGKTLKNTHVPGIAKAVLKVARGQAAKLPDLKKFKEGQQLIAAAIQAARAFSALRAQLQANVADTVVVGKKINVFIHFQAKKKVTVTSLNLYVTNHAKRISAIDPNPPFTVEGKRKIKITLALTLAGELTIGPLSFDFESNGHQFNSKTAKSITVRVRPAKAHVTLTFEQHKAYRQNDHIFAEGELTITNRSRGVVEKIELEIHPPPDIELVATAQKKSINMLSPGRYVSFPVLLKSKLNAEQTIAIALQVDQSSSKSEQIHVNFEIPEAEAEIEEDTDWLKDLEAP